MKIESGVEALEGIPMLYIKRLSAVVCSDLHLGYEGIMADKGTFLPKVNLSSIKEMIKKAGKERHFDNIIIDGDIKNEFSKVHTEELNEFLELVDFLIAEIKIKRIIIIKGNHDNFINRVAGNRSIEVHEREAVIDGFLFFHGEDLPKAKADFLVMGHMHPAVTLHDDLGTREKLRCFLYGKTADGRKLVVLPAMGYFAEGVSVNLEDVSKMAPIFKSYADIDRMNTLCVGDGETLGFGSIGELKRIGK